MSKPATKGSTSDPAVVRRAVELTLTHPDDRPAAEATMPPMVLKLARAFETGLGRRPGWRRLVAEFEKGREAVERDPLWVEEATRRMLPSGHELQTLTLVAEFGSARLDLKPDRNRSGSKHRVGIAASTEMRSGRLRLLAEQAIGPSPVIE